MSAEPENKIDKLFRLIERGNNLGMQMASLVAAGFALDKVMGPALKQQAALGELKSLGVASHALEQLNAKSLKFSIAYGENATAFVKSAYTIKRTIAELTDEQVISFAQASSLLAKGLKTDTATVGQYLGTLHSIFENEAKAMGKTEWVGKLTGTTALAARLFGVSAGQLNEAFAKVGDKATTAGIGMPEQMAVLGSLEMKGVKGQSGAQYEAFFKGAQKAQTSLGMSFIDSQGKMLSMLDILAQIKGRFGATMDDVEFDQLEKAFGSEKAADLIKTLFNNTDTLTSSLEQLGQVNGLEHVEQMAKSMATPWDRFKNAVMNVSIVFGQSLEPVLGPVLNQLANIGGALVGLITDSPILSSVIAGCAAALLVLVVVGALMTLGLTLCHTAMVPVVATMKIWNLLNRIGALRILGHFIMITLFTAGLAALYLWMGLVRGATLLWSAAIWLSNAALLANPIVWLVIAATALIAVIIAAIYYWDEWTTALTNSAAFIWIREQLSALSDWFDSMGGWSGLAKAAWDKIANVFNIALNGLMEIMNKIPGVNIDARFGEVPGTLDQDSLAAAQKAQQSINAAILSSSPSRANAVPPGGLLTSIQNTSNQNKGTHVGKIEIHTSKPITAHELDGMMEMAG